MSSKTKRPYRNFQPELIPCAGIVIFTSPNASHIIVVESTNSREEFLVFPKDKKKNDESLIDCAFRDILTKSNIKKSDLTLVTDDNGPLMLNEYNNKNNLVVQYLVGYLKNDIELEQTSNLNACKISIMNVENILDNSKMFERRKKILEQAIDIMNNKPRFIDGIRTPGEVNCKEESNSKEIAKQSLDNLDDIELEPTTETSIEESKETTPFRTKATIDDLCGGIYIYKTSLKAWRHINRTGIKPMSKDYILFYPTTCKTFDTPSRGKQNNDEIYLFVDLESAISDGISLMKDNKGVFIMQKENGDVFPREYIVSAMKNLN